MRGYIRGIFAAVLLVLSSVPLYAEEFVDSAYGYSVTIYDSLEKWPEPIKQNSESLRGRYTRNGMDRILEIFRLDKQQLDSAMKVNAVSSPMDLPDKALFSRWYGMEPSNVVDSEPYGRWNTVKYRWVNPYTGKVIFYKVYKMLEGDELMMLMARIDVDKFNSYDAMADSYAHIYNSDVDAEIKPEEVTTFWDGMLQWILRFVLLIPLSVVCAIAFAYLVKGHPKAGMVTLAIFLLASILLMIFIEVYSWAIALFSLILGIGMGIQFVATGHFDLPDID